MTTHQPGDADGAAEDERPLLASYRSRPDLDKTLRANLRVLRDRCDDEALRARFDDVLGGRMRLRDLALSADYQRFLGPLVVDGARIWEEAGRPADPQPAEDLRDEEPPPAPMAGGTW